MRTITFKPAAKPWRPSAEAATALLFALSAPRQPLIRLVSTGSRTALEIGEAMRISTRRDGTLRLHTREHIEGRWCADARFDSLQLLDAEAWLSTAVALASRAHLVSACRRAGIAALPADAAVYCERRLRADLFPEAHDPATRRQLQTLLLRRIAHRPLLRACLLVFGKEATLLDLADSARAGAATLEQLTREAPNLAPLMAPRVRLHARRRTARLGLDALGSVKRALLGAPCSPSKACLAEQDWRWLAHQPLGIVRRLCEPSAPGLGANPLRVAAVRAFAATGVMHPCPALFELDRPNGPLERVHAAIDLFSAPNAVRQDFARLLRLLALEARRRVDAGQSTRHLADDAGYLIDWWLDEIQRNRNAERSTPGAVVAKNATWTSLVRRQQRWHQWLILRDPEAMQSWASHLPAFENQGVRFVPLTDSLMLAREGMEMRHCVASYASDCARGGTRIFALEDVHTGERATLELRRRAWAWFAGQIKGPCNADVSDTLREAADRLAARYTHASRMA